MFCPRCGLTQTDDVKFCTSCGANLLAVRRAVDTRDADEKKFDWNNTWVTEMFLSAEEKKKRKADLELQRGITPEVRRFNEIKAGVIVSSVGIALIIFLRVFMEGIILGGKVPADTASILSHLWVAGVIPLFVGFALMVNGLVVSKRLVEIARQSSQAPNSLEESSDPPALRSADTNEFIPTGFSVTDHTTKHLEAVKKRQQ
jgi:zinc-ribbon domain